MPAAARWPDYLFWSEQDLKERLSEIAQALALAYSEAAMVRGQERRAKVTGFQEAMATGISSVTGAERTADFHALDLTTETMKLDGEIKALTEERDLLLFLLA